METTIETAEPKTIEIAKINFQPLVRFQTQPTSTVMRIEMEEDYTRIDFVIISGSFVWVQLDPRTYIRPVGTDFRLTLIKAQGIPLTPKKYYFKDRDESLYFTLFFPALPKGSKAIDIIEREAPGTYFNFYEVTLTRVNTEKLTIGS